MKVTQKVRSLFGNDLHKGSTYREKTPTHSGKEGDGSTTVQFRQRVKAECYINDEKFKPILKGVDENG